MAYRVEQLGFYVQQQVLQALVIIISIVVLLFTMIQKSVLAFPVQREKEGDEEEGERQR